MPTDQINRMNNNTNPLKKYPSKDPSDNYNAEASGGFDDNCFNKGRMFNPFPDYMITESSNQRLLKAKDNVIEAEGQVPDIGNQFAPDEKPTTALIELKSTEDLIKEFFSTWPQSINLQGIPTAPHDVKDMGPKGAYDPASNFSLTFAVENIVEPNRQSILSGVTHPVQKKFKKYRNDVMNRDQINEEVFDKDKKDVKLRGTTEKSSQLTSDLQKYRARDEGGGL
ncbi:uncharacterized protein B0J16DRAFT_320815 [Fusarium flagelliforme]|uniref:uncharacterized protein n=1 Tax=Fusarium flagelliforme TaxID=2675880 RepID=UPI001E8E2FFA|nr:uncharacterized protein B0J16DRAFT_320815 [Fusarium flagelliforme]KAH7186056.1 hypothetical protein B0J16DRAFT_320815 [Fusarium flagelliforme]